VVVGTVAYLAPEQLRGERAGPAADLWALGVTLHEALAGRRPFAGASHAAVMHAILDADPGPLPDGVPAPLAAVVRALLAKEPAGRLAPADEVARALRAAAAAPNGPAAGPAAPPEPLTALVGRGRELAEAARLLGDARLLTLVGAGGSGKTRLAAALASAVARGASGPPAADRAVWVELAPVADPGLVPAQIAAALRVPERAAREPLLAVADAVGGARVLLVLDNCEHLVDAAAGAADALLRRCPGLRVLATSREPLGVAGETAWLVPPLAPAEARALFAERARAAQPGFAVTDANAAAVDEICRRLDGIPLAIELAAARVRALGPPQIAARLDDAFRLLTGGSRVALPRQRTLRGTMDWSHALLGARDRVLLRRLAVFAGGFTLEAAEAVCGDAAPRAPNAPGAVPPGAVPPDAGAPDGALGAADVLDGLTSLVDKSLVTTDASEPESRYRLLETVRQYARERLAEAGEVGAYEAAHARYFLGVAEAAAPDLTGGEATPGLVARLTRDNDNFRAAMAWSLGGGDPAAARPEEALRLADALFWYWYGSGAAFGTGQFRPGRAFAEAALALDAGAPPLLRARALRTIAMIDHLAHGGSEAGRAAFAASVELMRGRAEPAELAYLLSFYGSARLMDGDVDGATALTREAQALAARLPPGIVYSFACSCRGWVAMARGDLAEAREALETNLAVGRQIGHTTTFAHGLTFVARLDLVEGRTEPAAAAFREALGHHLALNDPWGLGLDLDGLAEVALRAGRHADAARLMGSGDALRHRAGITVMAIDRADRARRASAVRAALGAEFEDRYAEGARLPPDALARLAAGG
jgi:non-specific serine/threonine protein kinase